MSINQLIVQLTDKIARNTMMSTSGYPPLLRSLLCTSMDYRTENYIPDSLSYIRGSLHGRSGRQRTHEADRGLALDLYMNTTTRTEIVMKGVVRDIVTGQYYLEDGVERTSVIEGMRRRCVKSCLRGVQQEDIGDMNEYEDDDEGSPLEKTSVNMPSVPLERVSINIPSGLTCTAIATVAFLAGARSERFWVKLFNGAKGAFE